MHAPTASMSALKVRLTTATAAAFPSMRPVAHRTARKPAALPPAAPPTGASAEGAATSDDRYNAWDEPEPDSTDYSELTEEEVRRRACSRLTTAE